jgi:hypothetical protein
MNFGEAIIENAMKWVGCKENPPGSNRSVCVDTIHEQFGNMDADPWCAEFVWVVTDITANQFGVSNKLPHTAGAKTLLTLSRLQLFRVDKTPAVGCIFYMPSSEGTGHVGFVIEHVGNYINTVEGNTSNQVGLRQRIITNSFYFIHVEDMTSRTLLFGSISTPLAILLGAVATGFAWKLVVSRKSSVVSQKIKAVGKKVGLKDTK